MQWKGFDDSYNTWEPVENLDCHEMISAFEYRRAKHDSRGRKSDSMKAEKKSRKASRRISICSSIEPPVVATLHVETVPSLSNVPPTSEDRPLPLPEIIEAAFYSLESNPLSEAAPLSSEAAASSSEVSNGNLIPPVKPSPILSLPEADVPVEETFSSLSESDFILNSGLASGSGPLLYTFPMPLVKTIVQSPPSRPLSSVNESEKDSLPSPVIRSPRLSRRLEEEINIMDDKPAATKKEPAVKKAKTIDEKKAYANRMKFEKMINQSDRGPHISVINKVDEEGVPPHFIYINESFFGPGVPLPDPSFLCGCDCTDQCGSGAGECMCLENNAGTFPYDAHGRLNPEHEGGIYECNWKCKCAPTCRNRVIQNGRKVKVSLLRFDNGKGWGVITNQNMPKGTFVACYTGEIITSEESDLRANIYNLNDRAYLFDLDFWYIQGAASDYTVDARQYGNITHFFNHSCEPNLRVYACFIDNLDPRLHQIAFFTCKDVKKGEELSFDYMGLRGGETVDYVNANKVTRKAKDFNLPCLCGAHRCRKYVYV